MPEVGENVQAQENQVQHQNRNINVNRNVNDDPNAPIDINLNRERREIAGGPQLLNRASISQNIMPSGITVWTSADSSVITCPR